MAFSESTSNRKSRRADLRTANLDEEGLRTLRALDVPLREERISHLEGDPGGAAGGLRRIHFEDGSSLEREGLFYVPPQRQGSELAKMLGCEIGPMGQAPAGVKSDPTTRETSVAGVYVAGDAGNAVQSALLAAASGANAAFFVNHSLVADEVAAAVGVAARFAEECAYPDRRAGDEG